MSSKCASPRRPTCCGVLTDEEPDEDGVTRPMLVRPPERAPPKSPNWPARGGPLHSELAEPPPLPGARNAETPAGRAGVNLSELPYVSCAVPAAIPWATHRRRTGTDGLNDEI